MLLELCAAAGPGRASGVRSLATAHRASCVWRADTSAPKGSGTAPLEWLVLGATCAYTCACACDPTRTTCIRRLDRNLFSGYFAALSLSLSLTHTHTHTHPPFLQFPAPSTRSLAADAQATASGCASGSLGARYTHFSSSFADHFSPSLSVRSPFHYSTHFNFSHTSVLQSCQKKHQVNV